MANRITPVKFHGATLITININGVAHVALKPICEAIGLDWKAQQNRIKRHPVLSTCAVVTTFQLPRDTQAREVLALPLDKLNGWLFGVNAARVRPELREKLIQFQRECFDVLHQHFVQKHTMISKPAPQLRIEHDSKGITPDMAATITIRAMEIMTSALPSIHTWLTDQIKRGCIAPGGGPAPNFQNTLVACNFDAFSSQWAITRLDTATRLLEFAHAETGRALASILAERSRLAQMSANSSLTTTQRQS